MSERIFARPKEDFELLGTACTLKRRNIYIAESADNLPKRHDGKKLYFLNDVLLASDEIEII
jgi:hypothetical protein